MKLSKLSDIAKAVNSVSPVDGEITEICTDTRTLIPGCLFLALKGDKFDGHEYIAKALESGAVAVICERTAGFAEKEILVPDTRCALMKIAHWYRRLFNPVVIAVTGSAGKTTTKEMAALVFGSTFKTLYNEGNLNNEIGLPKTLFNLDDSYQAAVLEMGMNNLGEISLLSLAAAPHAGIITNIGTAHIEKLGSKENILKAKTEITDGMPPDAPLIVNGDDSLLSKLKPVDRPVITFGIEAPALDFTAREIRQQGDSTLFTLTCAKGDFKAEIPAAGNHNVCNALAAIAAGDFAGIQPEIAVKALSGYKPAGMRQKTNTIKGIIFIEDCYNANPESMLAALAVLNDMPARRRIAVLGDMLELGSYSEEAHLKLGEAAAEYNVDILFTYGERTLDTALQAEKSGVAAVRSFSDKNEMAKELLSLLSAGDAVLFKGSRGMALEDVIDILYKGLEEKG